MSETTTANGTWIATEGSGPCVVLLHGLTLDHTMWSGVAAALSASFRVVTYDLLAHGHSRVARPPEAIDDYVSQLGDVVRSSGETAVHLVGFSFGSAVALSAARLLRPRSLTLMSMPFERSESERRAVNDRLNAIERDGVGAFAARAVERWFSPRFKVAEPEAVEQVRRTIAAMDPVSLVAAYRLAATADVFADLDDVTCPALVMTGAADGTCSPRMVTNLASRLSRAASAIIEDTSHLLPIESGATVAARVGAFLSDAATWPQP